MLYLQHYNYYINVYILQWTLFKLKTLVCKSSISLI